jgi:uncharacterized protein YggE
VTTDPAAGPAGSVDPAAGSVDPAAGGQLQVTGAARVTAAPDVALVRLAASVLAATAADAIATADAVLAAIRAALAGLGIQGPDAATEGLSVQPEQNWNGPDGPRVIGIRCQHDLLITVRDLTTLGRVLGQALAAAGDKGLLHGVEFAVADDTELRARARELAWQDALARATQLAGLAGRPLGPVLSVLEQGAPGAGPEPVARLTAGLAAADVSVTPGRVGITVALTVQWAIG